jgi:WD40 repeat protein
MEMVVSPCNNFLLLVTQKSRLELWDLRVSPFPQCIQRYSNPNTKLNQFILTPAFAGINSSFILWGREATGEEACINIFKRGTGELLFKIPGSGVEGHIHQGHSNIINQIDSCDSLPYLFVSCSDDETVKIWGVGTKIKIEVVNMSGKLYKENVVKYDVKNENEENKGDEEGASGRRSRSNRSQGLRATHRRPGRIGRMSDSSSDYSSSSDMETPEEEESESNDSSMNTD